ncbi:hypothetical protein FHW20_004152 [Ochrobactrum intermedium]|uniref:Transposase n=2 Tax=Brucella intermedia TaxID=94625 RepID=A0ABR6AVC6_9HYPH|nr:MULTISPECIES: hypothetical protein [Brucella/Ochrobactrum group]ERI14100.1 hypothetical protein O206_06800 [Ochrobactrum sp. EGD-AQ16]MBA8853176.1 hypothetical protein [Brucella intermedia]MDH0126411.1 hypothetical protein [Brucella intermedia GD04153]NVM43037.1 hypothetical protein [Brucella intermedia]NYD84116.1 hypothetical protein [Brucella intermedia]
MKPFSKNHSARKIIPFKKSRQAFYSRGFRLQIQIIAKGEAKNTLQPIPIATKPV